MFYEWYQGINYIVNRFSLQSKTYINMHYSQIVFERQWGINNLSWLRNLILFPKLLIVQERSGLALALSCFGLQTTDYWNRRWFLLCVVYTIYCVSIMYRI